LLGKKIVSRANQWLLILMLKDSGVREVLGNSSIDCLAGYFEERERLPARVEIAVVDRARSGWQTLAFGS
jgi:hypothetical protein